MSERHLLPERILCSPARRTRETLAALQPCLGEGTDIDFIEDLYEAPPGGYRRLIARYGADAKSLMVIGHNPSIQATALALAGTGEPGLLMEVSAGYPTGALAVITFETGDWSAIAEHSGYLSAFIRPRALEAKGSGD